MFHPGTPELMIILVIVVLIFGVGRIGKVSGELGEGVREFQTAFKSEETMSESQENKS